MMLVETVYHIGDEVYLLTDTEEKMRIVTGLFIRPGIIYYYLGCGDNESSHTEIEIDVKK